MLAACRAPSEDNVTRRATEKALLAWKRVQEHSSASTRAQPLAQRRERTAKRVQRTPISQFQSAACQECTLAHTCFVRLRQRAASYAFSPKSNGAPTRLNADRSTNTHTTPPASVGGTGEAALRASGRLNARKWGKVRETVGKWLEILGLFYFSTIPPQPVSPSLLSGRDCRTRVARRVTTVDKLRSVLCARGCARSSSPPRRLLRVLSPLVS